MIEVLHYLSADGTDVFGEWLARLKDARAAAKIAVRIDRLSAGNFGDCKALQEGVSELRIDWGPGYRVYFAGIGRTCVLLLCGGDKRRQSADIKRAIEFWEGLSTQNGQAMKRKASVSHDKAMIERIRSDPEFAAEYLQAAIEDTDEPKVLLIALRRIAEARGGIAKVAKAAGIERESLYRALSPRGNPRLSTLIAVTKAIGLKLTVEAAT